MQKSPCEQIGLPRARQEHCSKLTIANSKHCFGEKVERIIHYGLDQEMMPMSCKNGLETGGLLTSLQ